MRLLSLFYRDYWGWYPKMDFHSIGGLSSFPQLQALTLRKYVFLYEWQVDWFASLGKENSSESLEELCLDNYPLLFRVKQKGPFSSTDSGYPTAETVLGLSDNLETRMYPMRWHRVLPRWAESMKGLKAFRMGEGI